jgi:flavin-dependent dehydrogenase
MKIAVVGAGPAGVSAAFFCKHFDKENKHEVYLFERLDKARWNKYQAMCGEAVSRDLFKDIAPIKPTHVLNETERITEFYPEGIEIISHMDGYVLDRPAFLESILNDFQKLGGNLEFQKTVTIESKRDIVNLRIGSINSSFDYVIAADGANSTIRKTLGIPSPLILPFIQHVINSEYTDRTTLQFYLDERYKGNYKWVFPYGNKIKIGQPIERGKLPERLEGVITTHARSIGFGGVEKLVRDRVLLIGDAAGQTNAITKGGIRAGMVAGKLAAKAVINDNPREYERNWSKIGYSSPRYVETYKKLIKMDNRELVEHIKPFIGIDFNNSFHVFNFLVRTMFFYREYISMYKAYDMCNKWGW